MTAKADIQYCAQYADLPDPEHFLAWAEILYSVLALNENETQREITVRLVDEQEMKTLNDKWRGKPYATNVLAFPAGEMPGGEGMGIDNWPLGDIVICAEVVEFEAQEQGKPFLDRLAHMFIHGLLHLLGYDHQLPTEAGAMEGIEQEALSRLGYANPYEMS